MFSTDTWLVIVCSLSTNAVLFGTGVVTVLSVPALAAHAIYLIPAVVVASLALSPVAASWIAPRMRLRNWGRRDWREGDVISG
ncbi:hypothetical protein FQ775_02255 [Nitratireductor mangrovi]|uniref:Uncharacterized protein n=1 Tax=Nitratireductor mangrovi TaxID=2599600 RepID=A0A5B8KUH2_9HYPH|nr:hypothetical protein [Nitratireductor mangrovi]QDY99286.1 hypothetical protein FQ775_02255 [Nitratireductor mangrovi]